MSSSSSFYQHMRQSYFADPGPIVQVPISHIQQKLSQLATGAPIGGTTYETISAPTGSAPTIVGPTIGTETITESVAQMLDGEGDDLSMTTPELATLKQVEFARTVSLRIDLSDGRLREGETPNFVLLADSSFVVIGPKFIKFQRANGSVVMEIQLLDLAELIEDKLTMWVKRSTGYSALEMKCDADAQRSALYKLICIRRNSMEESALIH